MPATPAKSATQLLLPFAYEENWYRGEEYADKKLVRLQKFDSTEAAAKVHGVRTYLTRLRFAGAGLARDCSCPYVGGDVCKHMAALAIVWDEKRGLSRPSNELVATTTIAPPLVSMTQITAAFNDPLNADLEVLRMAASERGTHSRAHLRLPLRPPFTTDVRKSLTLAETKRALRELVRWTRREPYDQYLCGGEMAAAFSELLRIILRRADATPPRMLADILLELQVWHETMLNEYVDVRDGIEQFGQAHLDELYRLLDGQMKKMNASDKAYVQKQLAIFDERAEEQ